VPARIDPRPRTLPHLARGVAVLALGLGVLTACGGGSDDGAAAATTTTTSSAAETTTGATASSSSGGEAQAMALTATEDNFSISLDKDTLTAGTYEITVVNNGSATHDLAVEEDGTTEEKSDSIAPGESTTLTVDLDAGEYVFYCTIGNHRAMGMEITVQVT
jgi:plastocyanin